MMTASGAWDDKLCSLVASGVCGAAAVTSYSVTVALPGRAGAVNPPNAEASPHQYGTVLYAPPVPNLSLPDGQVSHDDTVAVSVEWSARVEGLSADTFAVSAATTARALMGAGQVYTLTVSLDPRSMAACPPGFAAGGSGAQLMCVRVVTQPAAWEMSNALCAPYSLATVLSAEHNALVASVRSHAADDDYW